MTKFRTWAVFLILALMVGCNAAAPTPTSPPSPTTLPSAPANTIIPPTQTSLAPTITPEIITTIPPTSTPIMLSLGRIYELDIVGLFAWTELAYNVTTGEIAQQASNSIYSSDDPSSPANSKQFAFSFYSDQIAYWTATTPGELWISDLAYTNPQQILIDKEGIYPSDDIKLIWLPDDQHLILYASSTEAPTLIYHVQTGTWEPWPWLCDSVILSPQSDNLALLCPAVTENNHTSSELYAIVEWGGNIWYSSEPLIEVIAQALPDGTIPWRFSPDGQQLVYFHPDDSTASLNIFSTSGNQKFLPGSSLLQNNPDMTNFEIPYYQSFPERGFGFFRWSRDGKLVLLYALGSLEHPCREREDFETGELFIAPCWQVFDRRTHKVIWTEADAEDNLFADEFEKRQMWITQAEFAPDGEMIVVRGQYFSHEILAVIDLKTSQVTHLVPLPYAHVYWANTFP